LEINIANLKERLQDMKIRRNYLQIEKDMIHDFYHNTREEIKELEARVTNFDTKMQNAESKHRTDIISHMQKVKHLEYEHQNSCTQVKGDAAQNMEDERNHHTKTEKDNLLDKKERKEQYGINEKSNIAEVESKEEELQKKVEDLQQDLEFQKEGLIESYELKLEQLEDELDLRMKVEIHELEERKNEHINELMHNHEQAFTEMKQYQNDITRENLELIKQHRERLTELKTTTATNENLLISLREGVKELEGPLLQAEQKRDDLKKQTKTLDKDTMALRNAIGLLKDIKKKTKNLTKNKTELD